MWAQRSDRQPMLQQITAGRAVLLGYIEWFNANGKPFIMTREARARVLRVPRLERPRQQRGPRPTGASTAIAEQTVGPYTSAGAGVDTGGPSVEPYTPMPQLFCHASSSQFQPQFTPMPPPTECFFCQSVSAIQLDEGRSFPFSWTFLPFSTICVSTAGSYLRF
ncbi:hypothetical protein V6N13_022079 [Hibiscus sabdariffa]